MPNTLLQICQKFAGRQGLGLPASVAASSDPAVLQLKGLLEEFCDDLSTRKFWQATTIEATFTTVAAEDQGAISTLFPLGFEGVVRDTMFDRTQSLNVVGGVSADEWQARKAHNFSGPMYRFRIRRNRLLMNPAPAAGHVIALEYFSNYFIQGSDGSPPVTTYRRYFESDTDICLVDDALPIAYLRWAWKKDKGLDYAEDFTTYERLLASKASKDARPQAVCLDSESHPAQGPGIIISPGSWPL